MSGTERDCEHKYVNIKHTKRSSVIENTTFAHKQKNSISLLNPSQCIKKKDDKKKCVVTLSRKQAVKSTSCFNEMTVSLSATLFYPGINLGYYKVAWHV